MSARSGGHHCNKTSDISDIPSYILAGSPAIQKIPLRFIRTSLMHSKCFYDSGPVRCGLGLIQSWLRIQPSQTSAGEHLRLFFLEGVGLQKPVREAEHDVHSGAILIGETLAMGEQQPPRSLEILSLRLSSSSRNLTSCKTPIPLLLANIGAQSAQSNS